MYELITKLSHLYIAAGIVEPPPATTRQIIAWVLKMYCSHILYMMEQESAYNDNLANRCRHFGASTPINLNTGKEIYEVFPLDTTGWRYEKLFKKLEKFPELMTDIIVYIDIAPNLPPKWERAFGRWSGLHLSMQIEVPIPALDELTGQISALNMLSSRIGTTVQHELVHATQTYISNALNDTKEEEWLDRDITTAPMPQLQFGLPPHGTRPSLRDPQGYRINPKTNKRTRLRSPHILRDVEFYPKLLDEIKRFQRYALLGSLVSAGESLDESIRIFVGAKKPSSEKNSISSLFFRKLRQHQPAKWRKAVKELVKVIYDVDFQKNFM